MIIWINGTFGVGKTTTGALLTERSSRLRLFDPESVGSMLESNLADRPVADFQQWEPWRVLTPVVADELVRLTGQVLVAPQTVLDEGHWDELARGLAQRGHQVLHVLLDAVEEVVRRRIAADELEPSAKSWRLDHLPTYRSARPWLMSRADLVLDTTDLTLQGAADAIWSMAASRVTDT